jgi:pSer/pThr/pTyr-binding forkhead associated (FHA) protein
MAQSNGDGPMIVAQTGPINGQRWEVNQELIIGRDETCDIVIPNRQVSRQHARINQLEDGIWLEDLNSRNGTHFNGDLISKPVRLQDGDIIQIALAQQFVFLSSDATMPLTGPMDTATIASSSGKNHILILDKRSRRVWVNGHEIVPPISASQFRLLELIYEKPGQVVNRSAIIEGVWGEENAIAISDQALDALVRRLRDRLAEFDSSHQYIVTVRGHGLRLENPEK